MGGARAIGKGKPLHISSGRKPRRAQRAEGLQRKAQTVPPWGLASGGGSTLDCLWQPSSPQPSWSGAGGLQVREMEPGWSRGDGVSTTIRYRDSRQGGQRYPPSPNHSSPLGAHHHRLPPCGGVDRKQLGVTFKANLTRKLVDWGPELSTPKGMGDWPPAELTPEQ